MGNTSSITEIQAHLKKQQSDAKVVKLKGLVESYKIEVDSNAGNKTIFSARSPKISFLWKLYESLA